MSLMTSRDNKHGDTLACSAEVARLRAECEPDVEPMPGDALLAQLRADAWDGAYESIHGPSERVGGSVPPAASAFEDIEAQASRATDSLCTPQSPAWRGAQPTAYDEESTAELEPYISAGCGTPDMVEFCKHV